MQRPRGEEIKLVKRYMATYKLTSAQVYHLTVDQLERCTELGREIFAVMAIYEYATRGPKKRLKLAARKPVKKVETAASVYRLMQLTGAERRG